MGAFCFQETSILFFCKHVVFFCHDAFWHYLAGEKERERVREIEQESECVCVSERGRAFFVCGRERVCVYVRESMCVLQRERKSAQAEDPSGLEPHPNFSDKIQNWSWHSQTSVKTTKPEQIFQLQKRLYACNVSFHDMNQNCLT